MQEKYKLKKWNKKNNILGAGFILFFLFNDLLYNVENNKFAQTFQMLWN